VNSEFDMYVVNQASCRASLLVATAGFPRDEWEDLRQQIILDCLRRMPKFDASRGERAGFVRGVMRNEAAVLVRRRWRTASREIRAAELTGLSGESSEVEAFETTLRHDPTRSFDISIDVRRILDQLPRRHRDVAYLVAELPVSDVCLAIGRSRSCVYEILRQIRGALIDAGIGPVADRRRSA
jgi:RNA polymerase sigma-70 factor (ECF subfamily)